MRDKNPVAGQITPKPKKLRAPAGLTPGARRIWRETTERYAFRPSELRLLESALRSWDRAEAAAAVVAKLGMEYVTPRTGVPHMRPAFRAELEARREFRLSWQLLGLVDRSGPEEEG